MLNLCETNYHSGRTRLLHSCSLLTATALLLVILSPLATADVVSIGDVMPVPSDAGGDVGGDLIIGDTGVGGIFMDIAPPLSGTLMPLQSANGIIGNGLNSIGAVSIDDFGVEWQVTTNLTVGLAGQGFMDLFDSAAVTTGAFTILGGLSTGQGVVTLNGVASRLETVALTVGELGVGVVEVTDRASLVSGISRIGNLNGSDGRVSLTDLGSRWTTGNLFVGNNGTGQGKLEIADQALVQATGSTTVNANGIIELNGGTFRKLTAPDIMNSGLVRGNGFFDASMTILGSGELRNSGQAGNYPPEEVLLVSGAVTNNGTIESLGGEMEFQSTVTNNLEVVARDAVMRFPSPPANGLINNGTLSVGGDTTIHGNISGTGSIFVLSDSTTEIVGDLTFSASSLLSLAVGDSPGTLDVLGTTDLNGALLSLDYSAGVSPQMGDTYQVFAASGGITGNFSNITVPAGGVLWDIMVGANVVTVTANGVPGAPVGSDFNGDNVVNGLDLIVWEMNNPITSGATKDQGDADGDGDVDYLDFLKIQRDFGASPPPPIVAAATAGTVVPEPGSLLLLSLGGILLLGRKRTRRD